MARIAREIVSDFPHHVVDVLFSADDRQEHLFSCPWVSGEAARLGVARPLIETRDGQYRR